MCSFCSCEVLCQNESVADVILVQAFHRLLRLAHRKFFDPTRDDMNGPGKLTNRPTYQGFIPLSAASCNISTASSLLPM
jgi:hypothetical protein